MRTLLATVATGALLGTAVAAQDATDAAPDTATDAAGAATDATALYTVSDGDYYASNLIGSRLYTTEAELGEQVEYATVSQTWTDVGEVNDFVVSQDGSVQAVIVGVGGFLGIGEKDVAVSWDDVSATYDENGSRFLVVPMTQEELESAPGFEYQQLDTATGETAAMDGAETDAAAEDQAMEMADGDAAATDAQAEMAEADAATDAQAETEMADADVTEASEAATDMAQAEATDQDGQSTETAMADGEVSDDVAAADATEGAMMVEPDATMPEGYELVAIDQVSAEDLEGATVRSASNDEWVGEISALLIDDEGKITNAVIDVGGFLGIGEKPVAMDFGQLELYRQGEGGPLEVNVTSTREELEGMQSYEG